MQNYELRLQGHLDQHWSSWFNGFALTPEPDGTTSLRGPCKTRPNYTASSPKSGDLGIPLISVTPLDEDSQQPQSSGSSDL